MLKKIRQYLHYLEKKIIPLKPDRYYTISNGSPLISFSFDDYSLSAGTNGAEVLNKYRLKGSFYVSLGKLGSESVVGKICDADNIKNLMNEGHEIGNHTYYHTNPFVDTTENYERSVKINEEKFKELFSTDGFETFAYPFGMHPNKLKKIVKKYYRCARTTTPGINFGKMDLTALYAFPIYGKGENLDVIKSAIRLTIKKHGWLNLYTHDVAENPSAFGCTSDFLEQVVNLALESGARIVTLKEACNILSVPMNRI